MNSIPTDRLAAAAAGSLLAAGALTICKRNDRRNRKKRIAILGGGTRGDVQPLLSLAVGIHGMGFEATVWCGDDGKETFAAYDIPTHPMRHNTPLHHPQQRSKTDVNKALEGGAETVIQFKHDLLKSEYKKILSELKGHCDLIISSMPSLPILLSLCGELSVPGLLIILQPWKQSCSVPEVFSATAVSQFAKSTEEIISIISPSMSFSVTDFDNIINCCCTTVSTLYGYPQQILSPNVPLDYSSRLLSNHVGYIKLPQRLIVGSSNTAEILKFINSTEKKVAFFGLGSMTLSGGDKKRTISFICQAFRNAGLRGIIQSGWCGFTVEDIVGSGIRTWAENAIYFASGEVDHYEIFPKCCLAIHHGGAGTTGSCLLAGIPSIVSPISFDQDWHAATVIRLACGYSIPSFTSSSQILPLLSSAISKCLDPDQTRRCHQVSEIIKSKNGLKSALEHISSLLIISVLMNDG